MFSTESFLRGAEDAVVFRKFREDRGNKTSPGFVDGAVHANGAFVLKKGGIVSFVEEDCVRSLPRGRCVASDPHDDEEGA